MTEHLTDANLVESTHGTITPRQVLATRWRSILLAALWLAAAAGIVIACF